MPVIFCTNIISDLSLYLSEFVSFAASYSLDQVVTTVTVNEYQGHNVMTMFTGQPHTQNWTQLPMGRGSPPATSRKHRK